MINLLFEPLPDTVEVSGNFYKIATDFRDWIAFFDMLADTEITSRQKISLALQWFTDEIPPDIFQAYNSLISFASCDGIHFKSESEKSGNSPESPSLSWLYDSAYVLGAFRQVYNIDLIRVEYMHWWEFSARRFISRFGWRKRNSSIYLHMKAGISADTIHCGRWWHLCFLPYIGGIRLPGLLFSI